MASHLNILNCDIACTGCIKGYKKKHDLKQGDIFKIACTGIPKDYVSPGMMEAVSDEDATSMLSMLDPVTWAAQVLDWHCIDPDGAIWKRKTDEGTLEEVTPYIEEKYEELVKQGKSAYNRPYQATMLRCSSKRKVFRVGRQVGKTETIVVAILHAIFTRKDFRVVIITPYQTQVELIFNRLNKLINSSDATSNSVKRFVKAPNFTIELHNGSTVRGFTAGTKSGGNADAVRGQKANMLVFDEADYLSSADMASALAVITNYPDATVWMSSTPSGKREKFYEACKSLLYKEFFYPSTINPLWGPELEDFYRHEYTSLQYVHEIDADFGEQEAGVYQSTYIEDAMIDYKYEDMRRLDDWIYSIGVDWNDQKVGSTICVTGFYPSTNTFKIFQRHVVQREGWTQMAACEKIVELNRYWRPKAIYIDKGFGGTQFEVLRKFGYDSLADKDKGRGHPDSKLHTITKQYDFGSKVTIKDLFTKQDVDKASKPFLVENSVRRFEQHMIQFSKHDTQLEAELRGYVIDHVTISGSPVYKQGNEKIGDHNLDALNLSLVAFTMEMSQFGKVHYETNIAFAPPLGYNKPPVQEGSIISNAKKPKQESSKPSMDRVDGVGAQQPLFKDAPGSFHTNNGSGRRLWSWPGFEKDSPRPRQRIPNGLVPGRRPAPPSRKKF